jgi:hypothetical protein
MLAVVLLLPFLAPSDAPYRAGTRAHPVYEKDPRVRKEVVLKGKNFRTAELIVQLEEQTGLVINFAPGLRARRVRVTTEKLVAANLMDCLAALFSSEWYAVGDRYILAHDRRLISVSALEFREAEKQMGRGFSEVVKSLTPEQISRLLSGETLGYDDLTNQQRQDAHTWALGAIGWGDNEEFALGVGGLERGVRLTWQPNDQWLFGRFEGSYGQEGRIWKGLGK